MNPTLIPGFEDIITHIRQQEQRIKNLEQNEKVREERVQELYQENQKLKEEKEKLYYQKMVSDNRVCTEATANLLLRNKNKVFEDQINQQTEWFKAINILVGSDEDEPAVVSVQDFVAEHKKLKEQIKKD